MIDELAICEENEPGINAPILRARSLAPIGLFEVTLAIYFDHLYLSRHRAKLNVANDFYKVTQNGVDLQAPPRAPTVEPFAL
jgi:hypothetical protein